MRGLQEKKAVEATGSLLFFAAGRRGEQGRRAADPRCKCGIGSGDRENAGLLRHRVKIFLYILKTNGYNTP